MGKLIGIKTKEDYSEHKIVNVLDGVDLSYFNLSAMTELQWKRFCRDSGINYFKRFGI